MSEYTQGVCHDGAAIMKDGQPLTIEQILEGLRERDEYRNHLAAIAEMTGNGNDVGAAHEGVNAVIEERDALAALLEAAKKLADEDRIISYCMSPYPEGKPEGTLKGWKSKMGRDLHAILAGFDATSLARRDALKQAEALERCAGQIMHDESREWMRCASKKLRKQAEGHQ